MLLQYAEANALKSEILAEHKWGRPPSSPPQMGPAAFGPQTHWGNLLCAPQLLKVLASAYFRIIGHPLKKNIGHSHITKAASHHLF